MDGDALALVSLALAKWVTYLGLVGLTGALGLRRLLAARVAASPAVGGGGGRLSDDRVARGLSTFARGSALLLVLGAAGRLYAQTYSVFGLDEPVTWELVRVVGFESRWGGRWMAQALATAGAAAAVAWTRRRPVAGWRVAAAATGLVWITLPLTGHAMTFDMVTSHLLWLAQIAHGVGVGLWIGTLAALLVVVLPTRGAPAADRRIATLVRRFSRAALVAVPVIALTGAATAVAYFNRVGELWTTAYGRTLLVKVALFLATGAVGAYNWRRVLPALDDDAGVGVGTLRRSARLELALAGALLVATALLVHLAMPYELG